MTKNIAALLATTALFFSTHVLANSGCGFEEKQAGFIATCSEEKQEVIITGAVTTQTLTEQDWYAESYNSYKVDTAAIEPLKSVTEATEIVVIIGTWCPDCHRETPRFIHILELVNNPNIKVTFIGVDRKKQDPEGLAAKYDFQRIPTFIVKQKGEEIGRIVERPEVSLEADLVKILN
ncbi:thioredoxin family protein [Shewanella sp. AS1]|uniref:thioredoxin family protein n=1 Tax=Shewanella sp. AS1 TaxID=2907626 RepID=UPI001F19137C|nr:thioredoxin family protein [Shewanella sp. AS1]MCE9680485.1 thioredoxin family protein [Shewanella sp. AS1]